MAASGLRLVIGSSINNMSQSHALQTHIVQLEELRSILNAMKNMAIMEIHKLSRLQAMQSRAVANIELAAMDFLSFYPGLAAEEGKGKHIAIVVGSERGFCGDFNESLIDAVSKGDYTDVIAVGNRLINKLQGSSQPIVAEIGGAGIAEEIPAVLQQMIETINAIPTASVATGLTQPDIRLTVVYHKFETGSISQHRLFPPFLRQQLAPVQVKYPPELNLAPNDFYADLMHHYLFAMLHEVFYNSLVAENHNRLQHLDGAVKHLDDETVDLRRKLQTFRQEEITEEIEVILLNSENT